MSKAIEFIMTWGWVFIIAMVSVAAMWFLSTSEPYEDQICEWACISQGGEYDIQISGHCEADDKAQCFDHIARYCYGKDIDYINCLVRWKVGVATNYDFTEINYRRVE